MVPGGGRTLYARSSIRLNLAYKEFGYLLEFDE